MKRKTSRMIAAFLATITAAISVAAIPANAIDLNCPVDGSWVSVSFAEDKTIWQMADGSVITQDSTGKIISQTAPTNPTPAPEEPVQTEPVRYDSSGVAHIVATSIEDMNQKLVIAVNDLAEWVKIQIPRSADEELYCKSLSYTNMQGVMYWSPAYSKSSNEDPNGKGELSIHIQYDEFGQIRGYIEKKGPEFAELKGLMRPMMEKAQWVVENYTNDSMTEYEKVLALHDYLCENVVYDKTVAHDSSAYGALIEGVCSCDGYTKSMRLLCYFAGIDCYRVVGRVGESGHAWNKIKLGDNWYNVDVTWDDLDMNMDEVRSYEYFLRSDEKFRNANHQWNENSIFYPASPSDYPDDFGDNYIYLVEY